MRPTPTELWTAALLAFASIGIAVGWPVLRMETCPIKCIMDPMTAGCTLWLYKDNELPTSVGPALATSNSLLKLSAGTGGPGTYTCKMTCPGMATQTESKVIPTTTTCPPSTSTTTNPPSTAQPTTPPANAQSSTAKASTTTGGPPTTFLEYLTTTTNPPSTAQPTTVQGRTVPQEPTETWTDPWTDPWTTTPPTTTPPTTTPPTTTPPTTTPPTTTPTKTTPPTTTPPTTTPPTTTPTTTTPTTTTPSTCTTPPTTTPPPDPCHCDVPCTLQGGECKHILADSCPGGKYPASNCPQLCPAHYVCCVPFDADRNKTCTARGGECQNAADNACKMGTGYYQTGLCPGDLKNQCCLPYNQSCRVRQATTCFW